MANEEGELGKHLTRRGFLTWAKRLPAVVATMRSLLAIGAAAQASGGSTDASAGNGATETSAAGSQDAAGGKASGSSQLRVQLPLVPQLISLQGFSAASCLLRPEWAWAIVASGFLSTQVLASSSPTQTSAARSHKVHFGLIDTWWVPGLLQVYNWPVY